ncbi:MAG: hypothetical protein L3J75_16475 [Methylococcaceae bacterium]|nr:hypothetical protein [Methylococcaceae bacterium]
MTKRLIIHIGHPKCASTSLQSALSNVGSIYYPRHGQHHFEHIAIPLKIKGLDDWTAQWLSQEWVDKEFKALVDEVNSVSDEMVVISSERLADITPDQLQEMINLFPSFNIELLLLFRPVEKYVNSMWRHAVFRHDMSEDFTEFKKKFKYFNSTACIDQHRDLVSVHSININDKEWKKSLNKLLGIDIFIPHDNVSASFECCYFLQQMHKSVGSEQFKKFFTPERKKEFSSIFTSDRDKLIEDFTVPIINQDKQ